MNILLINPNTSSASTQLMVEVARSVAPAGVSVSGLTAQRSPELIVDSPGLAEAAAAMAEQAANLPAADGYIVAAFGDPGLAAVRECGPTVGIAEAGMAEAARGGRRVALRLGRTASRVSSGAGDGPARAGDVVVGLEAVALTRSRESRRDAVTHIRVAIE